MIYRIGDILIHHKYGRGKLIYIEEEDLQEDRYPYLFKFNCSVGRESGIPPNKECEEYDRDQCVWYSRCELQYSRIISSHTVILDEIQELLEE